MFDKIKNSWNLMKASAAVLQADKELLIFPILSSIGVLILTAIFVFPMIAVGFFEDMLAENSQYVTYIVLFLFYVVQYTVIIFANSALVGAAMIRLKGGDPTVGDGFRIAFQHIGNILGYALLSATVGLILRMISERSGNLGRIAASLVGLAWNLATYLVVPVLVIEGVGPVEAIKRSAGLLKKTWGEQIVGNFSIGLIFVLVTVLVILLGIPFFILAISLESLALIIAFGVIFVLVLVFLGLINSTLTGIYVAAVYRYAAEGEASGFFDEEMIQGAFRLKE
ncbi:MAG: hypothetical protein KAS38_02635 [Anaerolineales bacterium]|nr:hypothetical protein [Anaerolineales bacterium]